MVSFSPVYLRLSRERWRYLIVGARYTVPLRVGKTRPREDLAFPESRQDIIRVARLTRNQRRVGARQQGGAFEKRRDFLLFLQYYILQEDQAWVISHLQSLRALHN
jgi:hypothetical protein